LRSAGSTIRAPTARSPTTTSRLCPPKDSRRLAGQDLVAPGDSNWALCDPDLTLYTDCFSWNGGPSPIQNFGGTSESAPLTSAAAADLIQAYASTHSGTDPSPALVKQILLSTATDIGAPATEQGAGLLNVAAAMARYSGTPTTSS
jgi:Subtilase family